MRPPDDYEYGKYKYDCREDIRNKGYKILLSIGDQKADLTTDNLDFMDDTHYYVGTIGDSNSYSVKHGDFEITAIGEVPAMTVEQIATTMRHP